MTKQNKIITIVLTSILLLIVMGVSGYFIYQKNNSTTLKTEKTETTTKTKQNDKQQGDESDADDKEGPKSKQQPKTQDSPIPESEEELAFEVIKKYPQLLLSFQGDKQKLVQQVQNVIIQDPELLKRAMQFSLNSKLKKPKKPNKPSQTQKNEKDESESKDEKDE